MYWRHLLASGDDISPLNHIYPGAAATPPYRKPCDNPNIANKTNQRGCHRLYNSTVTCAVKTRNVNALYEEINIFYSNLGFLKSNLYLSHPGPSRKRLTLSPSVVTLN